MLAGLHWSLVKGADPLRRSKLSKEQLVYTSTKPQPTPPSWLAYASRSQWVTPSSTPGKGRMHICA